MLVNKNQWKWVELGTLGEFIRGRGIPKRDLTKSGIRCVLYGELYTKYATYVKKIESTTKKDNLENSPEIKYGDILFATSGETRADIGKSAIYLGTELAIAGGDIIIFRPREEIRSLAYAYILESEVIRKQKYKLAEGHSVVHIYESHLSKLKVPLLSKHEQQKIASILSTWDEAISQYQKLMHEYKKNKKGLIDKLISSNLKSNSEWTKVSLDEILLESKKVSKENNEFPILTSSATGIYLQSQYFKKQVSSTNTSGYKIIKQGEFTYRSMSDTGYFKFNQLVDQEIGIVSPAYSVFSVHKSVNDRFIYYLMNSSRFIYETKRVSQGGTRIALRFNQLKNLTIRIPSRETQDQIANILDNISKLEIKHKEMIETLQKQKRGLMQLLLTGKVRV